MYKIMHETYFYGIIRKTTAKGYNWLQSVV